MHRLFCAWVFNKFAHLSALAGGHFERKLSKIKCSVKKSSFSIAKMNVLSIIFVVLCSKNERKQNENEKYSNDPWGSEA